MNFYPNQFDLNGYGVPNNFFDNQQLFNRINELENKIKKLEQRIVRLENEKNNNNYNEPDNGFYMI